MADFIVALILMIIVGAAIIYIRKEKKKGVKCIGCPAAGTCASRNHAAGACSCGSQTDTK
ncbi:MAG: FeoB-associated Cys-rich membrane protein [Dorea sp.]